MSEHPQTEQGDSDEELRLALAAAFGDEAMDFLDDDEEDGDEAPAELILRNIPGLENLDSPDNKDSSRLRWMKKLTAAIYADRLTAGESDKSGPATRAGSNAIANRFLLFGIGEQQFGLPLESVGEIARLPHVTELPLTPNFLRGITNVRGKIVSVTDFRNLIQETGPRPSVGEKIIIVHSRKTPAVTALIVDQVFGTRELHRPSPELTELRPPVKEIATGAARLDEQTIILIDADLLLGQTDLSKVPV